jgi:hypothetical protein
MKGMTYGWEAKYPRTHNYYFHSDKSFAKELRNLLIWGKTFIYKFSDIARMGTPHDGFTANNCPGYFFFTWDGKKFYVIEASNLKRCSDHYKWMDEDMASKMCEQIGTLK